MRVAVLILAIVGLLAGYLVLRSARKAAPPTPAVPTVSTPSSTEKLPEEKPPVSPSQREAMVFRRDGDSAPIVEEVDRVIGAGKSSAARVKRGEATWICMLVDDAGPWIGPEPYWPESLFPEMKVLNLQVPPPPAFRTLSIYRSVVARRLKLGDGDRILILVLPKELWNEVQLLWPLNDSVKN